MPTSNQLTPQIVRQLWRNWAVAFGMPAAITASSLVLPPMWVTLLTLLIGYALLINYRHRVYSTDKVARCSQTIWLTMLATIGSALIMTAIMIVYSPKVLPTIVAENPALPFITSLVVYPMMCAACIYGLCSRRLNRCCRRCQANHGYYDADSAESFYYYQESRFQQKICLVLSALVSVVSVTYYFTKYINVNLNSSDRFFFVLMPVALYLLSLGYMTRHYFTLYYHALNEHRNVPGEPGANTTIVRFLLLSGDCLLLVRDSFGLWDTPAIDIVEHTDRLSDERVRAMVADALPDQPRFDIKYIYTNEGYAQGANVLHYAVILPEEAEQSLQLAGSRWCNIGYILGLLRERKLSPYLRSELYRIHTITMAWKTYDREGRRLYPIKHYRPTFRLRDLPNWTVDYDDVHWMHISGNNQDHPLWHLRRLLGALIYPAKRRKQV